jgi:hypothetical protein
MNGVFHNTENMQILANGYADRFREGVPVGAKRSPVHAASISTCTTLPIRFVLVCQSFACSMCITVLNGGYPITNS